MGKPNYLFGTFGLYIPIFMPKSVKLLVAMLVDCLNIFLFPQRLIALDEIWLQLRRLFEVMFEPIKI